MKKPDARQTAIRRANNTLMKLLLTDSANERHTAADVLAAMVKNGEFDPHKHRVIIRKAPPTREEKRAATAAAWQARHDEFEAQRAERRRKHEEEMEQSRREHEERMAAHKAEMERIIAQAEEIARRWSRPEPTETEIAVGQLARKLGIH